MNDPYLESMYHRVYEYFLWAHSFFRSDNLSTPTNLFHTTIQKIGSQWIKIVFKDHWIIRCTGLCHYRQHRCEWNEFQEVFPWYTYGPGLFISYLSFEKLTANPLQGFRRLFDWREFDVPSEILDEVLADYTKEKMRQRDLRKRQGERSHYRKKSSDWREVFTDEHREQFYSMTGNLIEELGYDR